MKCRGLVLAALGVAVFACSSDPARTALTAPCNGLADFRFDSGGDGHADPFGAKAAGQARAGKIVDASQIVQGPLARQRVRVGDFALANDRIAVYIEAEGRADGYSPFGGDIVAIEPVGADGRPTGASQYGETLVALSRQTVKPDKVSVIADGSDGKAAIVRVSGVLADIPFLDTFKALSQAEYGFPAAIDYVLEPGAEKITYRLSIANATDELVDFANLQRVGFFHAARSKIFTEANGFAPPKGEGPWVAFDSGESAFLVRAAEGRPIRSELEVSGFQLFSVQGLSAEACETKTVDYLEIATGGPGIDGLLEAKRRAYGEPAWRELRGTLKEEGAAGLAGAFVHATAPDGRYLTRALTDADGEYVLHVPPGAVSLTPTLKGWAIPAATPVADGAATADLTLPRRATIEVKATDGATGEAIPVRVQVIPATPPVPAPAAFGLREEVNGRLWQDFAVTGDTVLPVPPGDYRVIVSRGYEYDILDTPVSASPAAPAVIEAALQRAVDTSGVMCADFHIHSFYSADSSDPADEKVKGAIADGLDIPVSSEHEWVIDFQPIIQRLGLTKWAFGMPSEELTTFTWGHFGVIPLYPREGAPNNGAIDWVGKQPPGFFKQVNELPENPVLIINHPSSAGFGGYFSAASFDRATGKGDPELWSSEFGAIEVFNDSDLEENRDKSVADWFALLNAGHTYWATGASDSHDQRSSPVGYPRTCLRFGHDDPTRLTPELVRDALRAGAATISGGLYITAEAPGGVGPGGTATAGAYDVVVRSPSWLSASSLEVIVDGVTTETIPLTAAPAAEPGNLYEVTVNVAAAQSSARHWVVFHAKGEGDLSPVHPNRKPFAVTNPIFF
ncbi:MAG: CehA/McbA family metallohydrolase [Labilithrix sp.]|nr:CehA/McbA family metallohydrolase [Labilithrix sp.]MCW5832937.1 CehA/McbA family metallohydrolase [Labilithrix sp.]